MIAFKSKTRGRDPLLSVHHLSHLVLFGHDGAFLAAKTHYGGHEVRALLPCRPSPLDVIEQILPLLPVPAVGPLILENSKQSPVKQFVESNMLWLNVDHGFILLCLRSPP